ncbi:MAG: MBL fold metallo-hydrolase [Beijerinckiaceae bacterium]|nr:MBL fold metallo-hydrolase [Beijerinckiaceae bacterium]
MPNIRPQRIGRIGITSLLDGDLDASLDKIPDPADREAAIRLIAEAGGDKALTMDCNAFMLDLPGGPALIDVGTGSMMHARLGHLHARLAETGVAHANIRTIFLTHVHKDHFGGLVDADGRAMFPNAEIVLHEVEAAFWFDRAPETLPERARATLPLNAKAFGPYAGRIRRVKEGGGLPGVAARLAPGHTPGHTAWIVETGEAPIVAWGDVVHLAALHLPRPETAMIYDLDPHTAVKTRRHMLQWVCESRAVVAASHLDAPGLGHIEWDGERYRFAPLAAG